MSKISMVAVVVGVWETEEGHTIRTPHLHLTDVQVENPPDNINRRDCDTENSGAIELLSCPAGGPCPWRVPKTSTSQGSLLVLCSFGRREEKSIGDFLVFPSS